MRRKNLTVVYDVALTPTGRRSEKRVSKRDGILETAAALYNEHGVAGVSLGDVAKAHGVGRASLYHYVADREDLVFQCFLRSCEAETERLDQAAESRNPLDQVMRYLIDSLAPDAARHAVITDVAVLSSEAREIIRKARRRNTERLAGMIGQGIEQGSIRPCDEQILARVLPAMVSFSLVARRWLDPKLGPVAPEAVADFVAYGSAADPDVTFECLLDAESFNRLEAASFDRKSLNDMRVEQIVMTGSRLFNERGYDSVSLEDVAAALGATRGALYHYIADKEELLRRCYERGNALYDAFIDAAEAHGRNGLEKTAIVSHLNSQAQAGALQPLASWLSLDALSPAQQQKNRQKLRALLARTETMAEAGVADGSRRPLDAHSVSVARAGAYMWIPKWKPEVDPVTPRQLADEIIALFSKGLARR